MPGTQSDISATVFSTAVVIDVCLTCFEMKTQIENKNKQIVNKNMTCSQRERRRTSPRRHSPRRNLSPPRRQHSPPPPRTYSPEPRRSPPQRHHHTFAAHRPAADDSRPRLNFSGTLPVEMASVAREIEYDIGKTAVGEIPSFSVLIDVSSSCSFKERKAAQANSVAAVGNWTLKGSGHSHSDTRSHAGGEMFFSWEMERLTVSGCVQRENVFVSVLHFRAKLLHFRFCICLF